MAHIIGDKLRKVVWELHLFTASIIYLHHMCLVYVTQLGPI